MDSSNNTLLTLMQAANPVIRIDGLKSGLWRRRMGENPNDFRLGPWRAADWSILDKNVYFAVGEVLYLLADGAGRVRYVGESKGRLRTRWRTPPLADLANGEKGSQIFHNIAWPKIEAMLAADPQTGPFQVSVIGVNKLNEFVSLHSDLRSAVEAASREHGRKHLSWHVETWLCQQPGLQAHLWNVAKRGRGALR